MRAAAARRKETADAKKAAKEVAKAAPTAGPHLIDI